MDDFHNRQKKLRIILSSSFKEKEKLKVSNKWKDEAMAKIRDLRPLTPVQLPYFILEQIFFRFTTAVTLAIIIGLGFLESIEEHEAYQVFYEEPLDEYLNGSRGIDI